MSFQRRLYWVPVVLLLVVYTGAGPPSEQEDAQQMERLKDRNRVLSGNSYFNEDSPKKSTTSVLRDIGSATDIGNTDSSKSSEWKKKPKKDEISTEPLEEEVEPKKNITKKAKAAKSVSEEEPIENKTREDQQPGVLVKPSLAFKNKLRTEGIGPTTSRTGWRPSYDIPFLMSASTTRKWPGRLSRLTTLPPPPPPEVLLGGHMANIPPTSVAWSSLASMKAPPPSPTRASFASSTHGKVKPFVPWSTRIFKTTTESAPSVQQGDLENSRTSTTVFSPASDNLEVTGDVTSQVKVGNAIAFNIVNTTEQLKNDIPLFEQTGPDEALNNIINIINNSPSVTETTSNDQRISADGNRLITNFRDSRNNSSTAEQIELSPTLVSTESQKSLNITSHVKDSAAVDGIIPVTISVADGAKQPTELTKSTQFDSFTENIENAIPMNVHNFKKDPPTAEGSEKAEASTVPSFDEPLGTSVDQSKNIILDLMHTKIMDSEKEAFNDEVKRESNPTMSESSSANGNAEIVGTSSVANGTLNENTISPSEVTDNNTTLIRVTFVNESTSESIVPKTGVTANSPNSATFFSGNSFESLNSTVNIAGSSAFQETPSAFIKEETTATEQTVVPSLPNDLPDSLNATFSNTIVPENSSSWKTTRKGQDTVFSGVNKEPTTSSVPATVSVNTSQPNGESNAASSVVTENHRKHQDEANETKFSTNVNTPRVVPSIEGGYSTETSESPLGPYIGMTIEKSSQPIPAFKESSSINQEGNRTTDHNVSDSELNFKSSTELKSTTEFPLGAMVSVKDAVSSHSTSEPSSSISSESNGTEIRENGAEFAFSTELSSVPTILTEHSEVDNDTGTTPPSSEANVFSTNSSSPRMFEMYPPSKSREEKQYYKKKLSGLQGRHHKTPTLYGSKTAIAYGDYNETAVYGSGGKTQVRSQLHGPYYSENTTEFSTESTSEHISTGKTGEKYSDESSVSYDTTNVNETTTESKYYFSTKKTSLPQNYTNTPDSFTRSAEDSQKTSFSSGIIETDVNTTEPLTGSESPQTEGNQYNYTIMTGTGSVASRPTSYPVDEFSNRTETAYGNLTSTTEGGSSESQTISPYDISHSDPTSSNDFKNQSDTTETIKELVSDDSNATEKLPVISSVSPLNLKETVTDEVQIEANQTSPEGEITSYEVTSKNGTESSQGTSSLKYFTETTPSEEIGADTASEQDTSFNNTASTTSIESIFVEPSNNTVGVEYKAGSRDYSSSTISSGPSEIPDSSTPLVNTANDEMTDTSNSTNMTTSSTEGSFQAGSTFDNSTTSSSSTEYSDFKGLDKLTEITFGEEDKEESVTTTLSDTTRSANRSQGYTSPATEGTESTKPPSIETQTADNEEISSTISSIGTTEVSSTAGTSVQDNEETTRKDEETDSTNTTELPSSGPSSPFASSSVPTSSVSPHFREDEITKEKIELIEKSPSSTPTVPDKMNNTVLLEGTTAATTRDEEEDDGAGVPSSPSGGGDGVQYYDSVGPPPLARPQHVVRLIIRATYKELCKAKTELRKAIVKAIGSVDDRALDERQIVILNLPNEDCSNQQRAEVPPDDDDSEVDDGDEEEGLGKKLTHIEIMLTDTSGRYDRSLTDALFELYRRRGTDAFDFRYLITRVEKLVESDLNTDAESDTDEITKEDAGVDISAPNNGTMIAAIVISSIAAVCLLFITILLVVVRKRQNGFTYGQRCTPVSLEDYSLDNISVYNSVRRKNRLRASKRSYGNPAFDDPVAISNVLNFAGLTNFANERSRLDEEFSQIPMVTVKPDELPPGSEPKNRYSNVIPIPETRVSLVPKPNSTEPVDCYINANYVRGPKGAEKFYIACQGPLPNTVNDFWSMIWQQQSRIIIMLTDLYENGTEKCADYLPSSEVLDCHRLFGDLQVTLKKREVREKYIISSLQLKNLESNLWREVTHLWYVGWPQRGVPDEASSLIALLIEARSFATRGAGSATQAPPIVLHCSPGTGRTGTAIAVDLAIRQFETERTVDIPATIYRIRRDRAGAVQTKDQYAFVYQVLQLYAAKLTGGGLDSI